MDAIGDLCEPCLKRLFLTQPLKAVPTWKVPLRASADPLVIICDPATLKDNPMAVSEAVCATPVAGDEKRRSYINQFLASPIWCFVCTLKVLEDNYHGIRGRHLEVVVAHKTICQLPFVELHIVEESRRLDSHIWCNNWYGHCTV